MASETVNHDPAPASPSELDSLRERIDDAFKSFAAMISAARRPLPDQTGNGKYLNEDPPDMLDRVRGGIADLGHLGIKDITTLLEMQRKKMSGDSTDDKQYLMEGLIEVSHPHEYDRIASNTLIVAGSVWLARRLKNR